MHNADSHWNVNKNKIEPPKERRKKETAATELCERQIVAKHNLVCHSTNGTMIRIGIGMVFIYAMLYYISHR